MASPTPVEVLLQMIPHLSDSERKKVWEALRRSEPTACDKTGHKYKTLQQGSTICGIQISRTQLFCEKCGSKLDL